MKNFNLLVIILSALLLVACNSDDDTQTSTISQKLVSITKDTYANNTFYSSVKYNFLNDEVTLITYDYDSYDRLYYAGDVISRVLEYDANDQLEWTTTYTYDGNDKMIKKEVIPSPTYTITAVSRQKIFSYDGNIIASENSWSDGGFHKNTIVLNNENLIIKDNLYNADDELVNQKLFEYEHRNLTKYTELYKDNSVLSIGTYNYLNEESSKEYRLNAYLFGEEWKNNSALNAQFGLGHLSPHKISEHYISDYYRYFSILNMSITGTFTYEFDANNYIAKQTENINHSTGDTYRVITSYEYE